jgi:hypothetical protein
MAATTAKQISIQHARLQLAITAVLASLIPTADLLNVLACRFLLVLFRDFIFIIYIHLVYELIR